MRKMLEIKINACVHDEKWLDSQKHVIFNFI